jgi:DNA-binding response OmpR family regulator
VHPALSRAHSAHAPIIILTATSSETERAGEASGVLPGRQIETLVGLGYRFTE